MMQRKKEAEKKLYEDFLNKEHNQKKGDTKEGWFLVLHKRGLQN